MQIRAKYTDADNARETERESVEWTGGNRKLAGEKNNSSPIVVGRKTEVN